MRRLLIVMLMLMFAANLTADGAMRFRGIGEKHYVYAQTLKQC